jgi:hypothetical protein
VPVGTQVAAGKDQAAKCQARDEGLLLNLLAVPANADKTVALQPAGMQAGPKQTGRSRKPENNDGQEIQEQKETKINPRQQH